MGIDARTPLASSLFNHVLGDEYNCKCNVGNGHSDAFGVHGLIMDWVMGGEVMAMLEMDARTPSESPT